MTTLDRRRFMKISAGIAATVSTGNTLRANTGPRPIRIGLIGSGGRGRYLTRLTLGFENIEVPAVCDINKRNLDLGLDQIEKISGKRPEAYLGDEYHYRKLLERDDLDAVMIMTPIEWHAVMSIDTMRADKHVGCEVTAGYELNELQELVRTKEQTGKRYMLLENYLYSQCNMAMYNIVKNGIMGDTYYGECAYIHDCTHLLFDADGNLTWRGELTAQKPMGDTYSTHSLGPLCKWMGINEGDRFKYLTSMTSRAPYPAAFAQRKFGEDSPAASVHWGGHGGAVVTLIQTAKNNLIKVTYSSRSPIPNENYHMVQGTKGSYHSKRGIYFAEKGNHRWEDYTSYMEKYNHQYWRKSGQGARETGHGGGDYFVMKDFVEMVCQNREPWIDVYDAVTWSMIGHFGRLSLENNGASQALPDFTKGKWKTSDWRENNLNPGFQID